VGLLCFVLWNSSFGSELKTESKGWWHF